VWRPGETASGNGWGELDKGRQLKRKLARRSMGRWVRADFSLAGYPVFMF